MESWRQSSYSDSHSPSDWSQYSRGQTSSHRSHTKFNSQHSYQNHQPLQNRYPEEWRNPQLYEAKRMRETKDRSAIVPCVKHFLFSVNVLFLLAGIVITSLSIYVLTESEESVRCFLDFLFNPACLLCLLGSLIVVPAFLGCYGALRENTFVIKSYFIMAIVLLLVEVVLLAIFFVFTLVPGVLANIGLYPEDFLEESLEKYGEQVHEEGGGCGRAADDYIDFIQDKFSCCGSSDSDDGYLDWEKNPYYNCNATGAQACSVPVSCCRADTTTFDCGANVLRPGTTDLSAIFVQGCEKGIRKVFQDNITAIGGCAFGLIFLQMLFIRCAINLNSQVIKQRKKWH